MENFVKKYSKLLEDSNQHLNYETIAAYINFYNDLSSKEKDFVKEHLSNCKECVEKYDEVFDEDFEFDDKTLSLNFHQTKVDEHKKYYQSNDGNIEIFISEENLKVSIKFLRLPDDLRNQNFRISTGTKVLRILSAREDESYFFNQSIKLEDIREIKAYILKTYITGKTISKSGSGRYYLFAAAAVIIAVFVIGYFYFTPVEEKVITFNKNKTAVDSSFAGEVEQNNKNGLKKTGENLIAENQINEEDFKVNPVLENFINRNVRSEEKEINIISPHLNDTLRVPFDFQWKSKLQPGQKEIVIVDNKNKTVWVKTTNGESLTFNGKLKSGLYYWKIFFNDQLKAVSKFYIRK